MVWGAPMATGGTASTPHGQEVVGWSSPSTVPTGIPPLDWCCKETCIEGEANGSPIHRCTACHLELKSPVVCSPAIPLVLDGVGIGHELASHGGANTCCCCHELMEARQPRIHVCHHFGHPFVLLFGGTTLTVLQSLCHHSAQERGQ